MKKAYDKPFAQKVAFSYQDQVMATSGYTGGIYNRDNTGNCQQYETGCNKAWYITREVAPLSLFDCSEYPGTKPVL